MSGVIVLDGEGKRLADCSEAKAEKLLASGRARLVSQNPFTIQLDAVIPLPQAEAQEDPLQGKRLLLHICCGPCATFTVRYFRERGAQVTGYWYNPNIHPYSEYLKRRETLARYAEEISLPVLWEAPYDVIEFFRRIAGHEAFGERCALCYRLRLERTARAAAEGGFDLFSTTLLISPYQNLQILRALGEELSRIYGVAFYFENLRRGFAEHHRLAEEHGLYRQRYCGCLYSEWESLDPSAPTHRRRQGG